MKRFYILLCMLSVALVSYAQEQYLDFSKTLRLDYSFSGNAKLSRIYLDELRSLDGWYGRRVNLDKLPLEGNGQITMTTEDGKEIIYRHSFSSLFQEWQATEEAVHVDKSFENVFFVPMPKDRAVITVRLYDFKRKVVAELKHTVNPADILIRPATSDVPYKYIHRAGNPEDVIDVAVVAEGYTASEREEFYKHAQAAADALFAHAPFDTYKDKINIVAVACESKDSGVSIPKRSQWKSTALSSNFDTFYSDRYLTTLHLKDLHNELASVPYEHIIILANTDNYGGGGIYNSYTLTTAKHKLFWPVVVHEFGHSFGGLADEYYYDDQYSEYYYPSVEPWEQNITTLKSFSSKWEDMIPEVNRSKSGNYKAGKYSVTDSTKVGVYEGAGYQSRGVYRPVHNCRMKVNEAEGFCPVCQRAIERVILFHIEEVK